MPPKIWDHLFVDAREVSIGPFFNIDIFSIEPRNIGIPVLNIALSYDGIGFAAIVAYAPKHLL